jgi:hypothetical protein
VTAVDTPHKEGVR